MSDHDSLTPETALEPDAPLEKAEPIDSRFLFVDAAAQRAKQLRRGARPRLSAPGSEPSLGWRPDAPHKLERVAMEEVKRGLVLYTLPPEPSTRVTDAG